MLRINPRFALVAFVIILVAAAASPGHSATQEQKLGKSNSVLRFFDNHSWLKAPNTKRCADVPWTRSCLIARERVRFHTRRIHAIEWAEPPYPFAQIARCEQRSLSGLHGVNWAAYSQSYEGAYGFLHETWDRYAPAWMPSGAHLATPRQQTIVARILVSTFNGYSSWPACHRRLGLPG